jgi:hypothetical protein
MSLSNVEIKNKNKLLNDLINGEHSLDEICVTFKMNKSDVETKF